MNRATANILDQQLLGKYRYSLHQLMEVAGLSVAQAIHAEFGTTVSYALVIAGPGNNGGIPK